MILHKHTPQELEITNKENTIIVRTKKDIERDGRTNELLDMFIGWAVLFISSIALICMIIYFAENINLD